MVEMTDTEKFLWDLQGFLVVKGVLSGEEVAALNAAIDAKRDKIVRDGNDLTGDSETLKGERSRQTMGGMLQWEHPWCEPFRRLIAHPNLRPHLNSMLGPGWRMDHSPQAFIAQKGAEGLLLHGSGQHAFGPAFYTYNNGRMWSGMISVEYILTPVHPGDGAFCAIPASHKMNFHAPREILAYQTHRDIVREVPVDAGDVLIFNEALVHGTLPWNGDHERRALLYRYSPAWLNWAGRFGEWRKEPWMEELTDVEQSVLEPPHASGRAVIADDGSLVKA